jgi:hypothetical protein
MRDAGDVEGRTPVADSVLTQVEIVADAMQPDREQADAMPVVEPTVDKRELGRLRLDEYGGERGADGGEAAIGNGPSLLQGFISSSVRFLQQGEKRLEIWAGCNTISRCRTGSRDCVQFHIAPSDLHLQAARLLIKRRRVDLA